jgi:uncharacterized protein YozE (UPF0346 family)
MSNAKVSRANRTKRYLELESEYYFQIVANFDEKYRKYGKKSFALPINV